MERIFKSPVIRDGIDRRMMMGGLATAALLGPRALFSVALGEGQNRPGDEENRLAVRYLAGSKDWPSFDVLPWQQLERDGSVHAEGAYEGSYGEYRDEPELELVAAERLPLGQQDWANGTVEMTVHGLLDEPDLDAPLPFRTLSLSVRYPHPDSAAGDPLEVLTWFADLENGGNLGSANRFTVPLGPQGELGIEMTATPRIGRGGSVARPAAAAKELAGGATTQGAPRAALEETAEAVFTVDWWEGRPKLQRGVYLIGLSETSAKRIGDRKAWTFVVVSFDEPRASGTEEPVD